jgi:hypothetical protein
LSTQPTEIATNPIDVRPMPPELFVPDGLAVADPRGLLREQGLDAIEESAAMLSPVQGGVQDAPVGAIQDPAGTAIGSGRRPAGGGASGAIYARFPDLMPIPSIAPRSAIFNSSPGAGRRVLHTYSPRLTGSPGQSEDRRLTIEDLANSYANALVAFDGRAAALGDDGASLNLVPVSAGIFAGRFTDHSLDHLHPTYTLCALLLALGWWRRAGGSAPNLAIYFFRPDVFGVAAEVLAELSR